MVIMLALYARVPVFDPGLSHFWTEFWAQRRWLNRPTSSRYFSNIKCSRSKSACQLRAHSALYLVGNAVSSRASRHGKARWENGIPGRSKRGMTGRTEFAKANGEFSVEGVTRSDRGDLNKWLVAHIIPHQTSNGTRVTQRLAEPVRWRQENESVFYSLIQLNKHGYKRVTTT